MQFVDDFLEFKATFVWKSGETFLSDFRLVFLSLVAYVAIAFWIQWMLKDRKPLNVTYIVVVHNAALCLVSLAMFLGTLQEVFRLLFVFYPDNYWEAWCDHKDKFMTGGTHYPFWCYIYYLTKFWEVNPPFLLSTAT